MGEGPPGPPNSCLAGLPRPGLAPRPRGSWKEAVDGAQGFADVTRRLPPLLWFLMMTPEPRVHLWAQSWCPAWCPRVTCSVPMPRASCASIPLPWQPQSPSRRPGAQSRPCTEAVARSPRPSFGGCLGWVRGGPPPSLRAVGTPASERVGRRGAQAGGGCTPLCPPVARPSALLALS